MVEICLTVLGLCLTVLGLIFAYVWKGNHKMEKVLLEGQEILLAGQERLSQGQERMEKALLEGFKTLSEMLLNQTKILERIEAKIPLPA